MIDPRDATILVLREALEKFRWAAAPEHHQGVSAYPYEEIGELLADTAQAATEYRERIVREEREAILAGVNPSVDELASVCFYCNSLVTLDYVLSDEFWQRAVPKEARLDVVCLSCLESLCPSSGVPEKEFVMLYYSGKSGTAAFIPAAAIRARGGSP